MTWKIDTDWTSGPWLVHTRCFTLQSWSLAFLYQYPIHYTCNDRTYLIHLGNAGKMLRFTFKFQRAEDLWCHHRALRNCRRMQRIESSCRPCHCMWDCFDCRCDITECGYLLPDSTPLPERLASPAIASKRHNFVVLDARYYSGNPRPVVGLWALLVLLARSREVAMTDWDTACIVGR
jgi:hypothetical protein